MSGDKETRLLSEGELGSSDAEVGQVRWNFPPFVAVVFRIDRQRLEGGVLLLQSDKGSCGG